MKKLISRLYIYLLLLFLYVPIAVLIVNSFNSSKSRTRWESFTLDWYTELFKDERIMSALYYTVLIALIAAVVSTIIGTAAAIGINSFKNRYLRKIVLGISYIPVLNPDIVTGISLMLLFLLFNIKLGFTTMLLAHIGFGIPYVILSVLPKLKQSSSTLYEAALDLGASPMQALTKVILPEIKPGIVTGFLLSFTMSIDDFVISFFTTGSGVSNLSIEIYSMARMRISPKINALSTIMFAIVMILLLAIEYRRNKMDKKEGKSA